MTEERITHIRMTDGTLAPVEYLTDDSSALPGDVAFPLSRPPFPSQKTSLNPWVFFSFHD